MLTGQHQAFLLHQIEIDTFRVQLVNILSCILVMLGVIGNIFGLFIFASSRRTWRVSSSYACLAACNSITNLFCVFRYASILHSMTRFLLHQLVGEHWWACKFYEFSFSFRIISSWITLFWMFERLMRVSRRLRQFCHRWCSFKFYFLIPILLILIILVCVIGPPMYMYEPQMTSFTNATNNVTQYRMTCELHSNASIQWHIYFHQVHLGMNHFTVRCLFSELIPTGAIILFNAYIIYQIFQLQHHLCKKLGSRRRKTRSRTTSWMNIVLVLHSTLFLSSLIAHIIGHFLFVEAHETWWVFLMILISCSLNFYIYCLFGRAFRSEIRRFIRHWTKCLFNNSQTLQQRSNQNQRFIQE